ncbi:hypothetical protein G7Y89_g3612 [Cudoniella acicularis]|uniref:Ketoreductase domain-containing protein n=1 Tax=Cudoniella acicularis TaxID=354080 RepID=A0A8H4RSC2_9HELO|nr:hypothetical protein G7Y89_g3612 [Cudoniella acicularis]
MTSEKELGVVLVVGGCGYLGSNVVQLLSSEPSCSSVHVLSRNPTLNLHPNVNYHAGDIANQQEVKALLDEIKPRVIIHTATPPYTLPEKVMRHTNVMGTRVLLQCAAADSSVRAFVYTSTDSAVIPQYGVRIDEEAAMLYTETSQCNPYERTKAMADAEVLAANAPALTTAVLRVPAMYGEKDDKTMTALLGMVKKGQHKTQIGNNKNKFEFLFVESAATAHILAAKALLRSKDKESSSNGRVDGEAFFISDGVSVPYFDFARKVFAMAGYPVEQKEVQVIPYGVVLAFAILGEWMYWIFTLGTKQPDIPVLGIKYLGQGCCDWNIEKAKTRLGFEPVPDQDVVLKKVVESEMKRLGVKPGPQFSST